jgi:ketosteroid isomerase-like protein
MRIDRDSLADLRAVEQVKYDYCWHYDSGELDDLVALFAEDAVCELGPFGTFRGLEEIRTGYAGIMAATGIPGSRRHVPAAPRIDVHGDVARAQWYLVDFRTENGVEQPVRIFATYDDELRRVDGDWRIARTSIVVQWSEP